MKNNIIQNVKVLNMLQNIMQYYQNNSHNRQHRHNNMYIRQTNCPNNFRNNQNPIISTPFKSRRPLPQASS